LEYFKKLLPLGIFLITFFTIDLIVDVEDQNVENRLRIGFIIGKTLIIIYYLRDLNADKRFLLILSILIGFFSVEEILLNLQVSGVDKFIYLTSGLFIVTYLLRT